MEMKVVGGLPAKVEIAPKEIDSSENDRGGST
jgi:hypothetical protein